MGNEFRTPNGPIFLASAVTRSLPGSASSASLPTSRAPAPDQNSRLALSPKLRSENIGRASTVLTLMPAFSAPERRPRSQLQVSALKSDVFSRAPRSRRWTAGPSAPRPGVLRCAVSRAFSRPLHAAGAAWMRLGEPGFARTVTWKSKESAQG